MRITIEVDVEGIKEKLRNICKDFPVRIEIETQKKEG